MDLKGIQLGPEDHEKETAPDVGDGASGRLHACMQHHSGAGMGMEAAWLFCHMPMPLNIVS